MSPVSRPRGDAGRPGRLVWQIGGLGGSDAGNLGRDLALFGWVRSWLRASAVLVARVRQAISAQNGVPLDQLQQLRSEDAAALTEFHEGQIAVVHHRVDL